MPPVLYIITVTQAQRYLTAHYNYAIKNIYLSDMHDILAGTKTLESAIADSINHFIKNDRLLSLGVDPDITITTKTGIILYPPSGRTEAELSVPTSGTIKVARRNFKLMEKGLEIKINATIRPYSLLAVSILCFYMAIAGLMIYIHLLGVSRRIKLTDEKRKQEIERLVAAEKNFEEKAKMLADEKSLLESEYERLQAALKKQKLQAEQNEEAMFDELVSLEKQLQENIERQKKQQEKIDQLTSEIQALQKLKESVQSRLDKAGEKMSRRFSVLYKNIHIGHRAVEGLLELDDDMALKAEEIIHQLNDDASKVPIKRKVFSRRSKLTVFEVVFAYRGRLYFSRNEGEKINVICIGTKNTQHRDLAYIDSL